MALSTPNESPTQILNKSIIQNNYVNPDSTVKTQNDIINSSVLPSDANLNRLTDKNSAQNLYSANPSPEGEIAAAAEEISIPEPKDQTTSTIFMQNDIWKIQVSFDNQSPPVKPFVLKNNKLIELAFDHNIIEGAYLKGYVTISGKRIGDVIENNELNTEFVFRGDGRDEINLELNPSYEKSILPEEVWFTKLKFIVYDVEDLPADSGHYKRVHFYHKPYYIMKTRNLKLSSSELIISENIQSLSNEDRMVYTGDLIKQAFINLGLVDFLDNENWDKGNSKIFYNSPANNTAIEEIQYILKQHTSEKEQSPCILYYNRGINKFQLISLPAFFSKAGVSSDSPGEYQLEHFYIKPQDTGIEDAEGISKNRAPLSNENPYKVDFKHDQYSLISENSYSLFDMSSTDSMLALVTRPVHTYTNKGKKFSVNIIDNDIQAVKTHFKETYTDLLYPGPAGSPLFVLNRDKINAETVHNGYITTLNKSPETLLNYGRNFTEQGAIFLNLGINFRVPGSSHRHPGRFFGLEKNRNNTDNKYDYRLLGQWFITRIVYSWHRGEPINFITAVKTHSYGDLKFNEDV